jgi:hypothetical protein
MNKIGPLIQAYHFEEEDAQAKKSSVSVKYMFLKEGK